MKVTFDGRTNSKFDSNFDSYSSGSLDIGPFKLNAGDVTIKRSSTSSSSIINSFSYEVKSPALFGLVCKKMNEFPKLNYSEM
jgi:hypothetical protein